MAVERWDAVERIRAYQHIEVIHGAGQIDDFDLSVRECTAHQGGHSLRVDHRALGSGTRGGVPRLVLSALEIRRNLEERGGGGAERSDVTALEYERRGDGTLR